MGGYLMAKESPLQWSTRLGFSSFPFAKAHFLHLLGLEGVEPERVDLLPLQAANTDHLATYAFIDISLDPYPYAGETLESLSQSLLSISYSGFHFCFKHPTRPHSQRYDDDLRGHVHGSALCDATRKGPCAQCRRKPDAGRWPRG